MSDLKRPLAPLTAVWDWQLRAACRGLDTALFFHPSGERGQYRERRELAAKAVCAGCPVRLACRAHALAAHEPYGVWGGLSSSERDLLVTGSPDRPGGARALLTVVMTRTGSRPPRSTTDPAGTAA